ncbi:isochorismatase family protein [Ureibacillus aquaedulcis]|uniref:Isochorismatase family protein n=1 Tax=Ureibacillus aquaedulcis TaxID=3058421 RepID=A0ABT8GKP4_9BACL|nr:isochorismatase family protein [Ureibacillus sp. BA0131]MDN4491983.1 isochorismatase family protein [Ureibacillus sp. BA0131]
MTRVWDSSLTATDKIVIEKGGYGQSRGLGKNPLLVIIDAQYNYIGADKPIAEQLDEWPSGGGDIAWKGIRKIEKLKESAVENNIPVLYTRNVQKKTIQFDSFSTKAKRDQTKYLDGNPASDILECLAPTERDIVVDKSYASAFFGTPLISYLVKLKIDSLVIVGGSTSGCVRATAVDAVTHNFNVAVIEDAVFDRIELSHKAALLDLWMKYCDVVPSDNIFHYFNEIGNTQKEEVK